MTYQNDPNINRREKIDYGRRSNTGMWLAGAVALALVVAVIGYAVSTNNTHVAGTTPAATERTTTGSGATTPPATTQQKPVNAPVNPPATSR